MCVWFCVCGYVCVAMCVCVTAATWLAIVLTTSYAHASTDGLDAVELERATNTALNGIITRLQARAKVIVAESQTARRAFIVQALEARAAAEARRQQADDAQPEVEMSAADIRKAAQAAQRAVESGTAAVEESSPADEGTASAEGAGGGDHTGDAASGDASDAATAARESEAPDWDPEDDPDAPVVVSAAHAVDTAFEELQLSKSMVDALYVWWCARGEGWGCCPFCSISMTVD